MKFKAIDLTRITQDELRFGIPLCKWPTVEIDIDDDKVKEQTCIASWRWDINSIDEISNRMSECAWDALNFKFKFLLCDLISIPQDSSETIDLLITFSKLYYSLQSVVAYDTDVEIKRTWLKNEAIKILDSPTSLFYICHKWKLRVPLKFSLIIRQVCTRRLGLHELNFNEIDVCDTDEAYYLSLRDLNLLTRQTQRSITTISLDRRHQKYASDVLLVYEINKNSPRLSLVAKLNAIKSNSVVIPALLAIWAMVEGLSISIRGCDWDVDLISKWAYKILAQSAKELMGKIDIEVSDNQTILVKGTINGALMLNIVSPPYNLDPE